MTNAATKYIEKLESDTQYRLDQAAMEAAALRGERGLHAQLVAMSAIYHEHKAAGRLAQAAALKEAAQQLVDAAKDMAAEV